VTSLALRYVATQKVLQPLHLWQIMVEVLSLFFLYQRKETNTQQRKTSARTPK
jgi:hypothetical protein